MPAVAAGKLYTDQDDQKAQNINQILKEIEQRVRKANELFSDKSIVPDTFYGNQQRAREIYLQQANNLMTIAEKTKDNPDFNQILQTKIGTLILMAKKCQLDPSKKAEIINKPIPLISDKIAEAFDQLPPDG